MATMQNSSETGRARLLRTALIGMLLALGASAARGQDGGQMPVLLSLSQGARSLTSDTSLLAPGVEGALMNPASLGMMERLGVTFNHNRLFLGTSYNNFGMSARVPRFGGGVGLGFYRLATEEAEKRNNLGDVVGSFRSEETVFKMGYGRSFYSLLSGLSAGTYLSLYRRSLDDASDGFYTADVGGRYVLPFLRDLSVGLMFHNMFAKSFGGATDKLPRISRFGASYAILDGLFAFSSDLEIGSPLHYSFGIGYAPVSLVSFNLVTRQENFGGGVSVRFKDYQFRYNLGMHELGSNHQIGMSFYFGKPDSSMRRFLEQLYSSADQEVQKGEYLAALKYLQKAQRFAPLPEKEKALYAGLVHLKEANIGTIRGEGEGAELIRRGVNFYLGQKNDMAQEIFKAALYKDPRSLVVRRLMAIARGGEGKDDQTVSLPSFTEVDPIQLKLTKAEQFFQDQMWDLALKELREVIEINPKETAAYVRLGSIYYVMGLKQKAKESWAYAVQLDPKHPDVVSTQRFMREEGLQ